MKKILALVLALAVTALSAGASLASDPSAAPAALEFKLKTASGVELTQENLKGKATNLLFVQMACRQCRLELNDIHARFDEFKDKVTVVLVDMNPEAALNVWNSQGYKFDPVLDPGFNLAEMLKLRSTPATVKLDGELKTISVKYGYKPADLEELLK